MRDRRPGGGSSSPADRAAADAANAKRAKFLVLLAVGVAAALLLGSPILVGAEVFYGWVWSQCLQYTTLPTPAHVDLVLAAFTSSLFIAELFGFFPPFPENWTAGIRTLISEKTQGPIRAMLPGFLF